MPGTTLPTSQLDWLSSTTAMIVLSWSRGTRDLLKSFGWGIAALHRLCKRRNCHPRRPPHSISPPEGHGFEPPVPPESTRSGLAELNGSCAVFSLLPVHHRKAAVELSGEPHAGVDVDCTFHRVSGGDQCRRSLQARGLQRGFLFVGHETRSPGWRPQP